MDDTAQTTTGVSNDQNQQAVSQASAAPVQQQTQPTQMQHPVAQPVGRHPEQGPIAAPAQVAETPVTGPDTVSDASDVADAQQMPDVVVKESQPAVEVPQELKEIGVEQSAGAKQDRPEEQQQVDVTLPQEQPSTAPVTGAQPLPMDYKQAIATQKSSKIRDSLKWLATLVKYQWEQIQVKGEEK